MATVADIDGDVVVLPADGCPVELVHIATFDTVVHVLDLDAALQERVSPRVVLRFDGRYGPEIPFVEDADGAVRLFAFTGRSLS